MIEKPKYLTVEFWAALISGALLIAMTLGLLGQDEAATWEQMLVGLAADPAGVAHLVDWVAKKRVVDAYANRHGLRPGDARLKALENALLEAASGLPAEAKAA